MTGRGKTAECYASVAHESPVACDDGLPVERGIRLESE